MLTNVSKEEKFAKEFLYYAAYDRICVNIFFHMNIAMRDFRQYVQYERAL